MDKKEIKDRLYTLLVEHNEKPIDMANKLNIPKSSLSLYLSGKREPRQNVITKIATAYGVQEAWLMGYDVIKDRKEEFSVEQAELDAKISNDLKLKEALKVYFSLPDEKKALIIELIKNFQ